MPDITMCQGENCSRRDYCYRFTATPTPRRQSYLVPSHPGEGCEHFRDKLHGEFPARTTALKHAAKPAAHSIDR